jgi:hypothetical protein
LSSGVQELRENFKPIPSTSEKGSEKSFPAVKKGLMHK